MWCRVASHWVPNVAWFFHNVACGLMHLIDAAHILLKQTV